MVPDAGSRDIAADPRDIVVRKVGGGLHHISEFNQAFDPLHFVLLYPRGERGWGLGIPRNQFRDARRGAPVRDDVGDVQPEDLPVTGFDLDLDARGADREGEDEAAEEGRPGFLCKTVTARDYMAYHLFTRSCPCGARRPLQCHCARTWSPGKRCLHIQALHSSPPRMARSRQC